MKTLILGLTLLALGVSQTANEHHIIRVIDVGNNKVYVDKFQDAGNTCYLVSTGYEIGYEGPSVSLSCVVTK